MDPKTRIDLNLLLPDLPSVRDRCVERITSVLEGATGIQRVHIVEDSGGAMLCLHYDPAEISPSQVQRMAQAAGADITERYGHAILPIRALTGEDSWRRIEAAVCALAGVEDAAVNLAGQTIRVEWDRTVTTKAAIEQRLQSLGVHAQGASQSALVERTHKARSFLSDNKELVWSIAAGLVLIIAWLGERFAGFPAIVAIPLYLVSYALGGWDLASHWVRSAIKGRITFDIDLLMLMAAIGAAILGEWAEGALLLFLFSLAHALEHYAMGRARNAIKALAELTPDTATVLRDGIESEVPIEAVAIGDVVVVLPGQRIPVDGTVRSGRSSVNQAPITGESVPVEKFNGETVYAGSVNGEGALEIINQNAVGDRTLDRVVKLVQEAQTHKAPTEYFVDRFAAIFVPVVLVAALLLIVIPPMLGLLPWTDSFYRGMALLVAASPCALALGTPSAVLAGIAQAARGGVLVKGGMHLEGLATVRAMAFDKTGTLTVGRPEVTDVVPAEGVDTAELLGIAAAVEARSQHPLADAVVRRADSEEVVRDFEVGELQSLTGRGVESTVEGVRIQIGNLRLWREMGESIPDEVVATVERLSREGKSILVIRHGERWLGTIGVADLPRHSARWAISALRKLGIERLVMLTGDNLGVGQAIGRIVGVDEVQAELMPQDKVIAIRKLLDRYDKVAMTGDGVNDAPALANATVGIAMGGAGTAAALETADVALMGDDLAKMPFAVGLARQAGRIIRQNVLLALGVIVVLAIGTATGKLGIGPAVVFHEGSTLVVIANSLRLLGFQGMRMESGATVT